MSTTDRQQKLPNCENIFEGSIKFSALSILKIRSKQFEECESPDSLKKLCVSKNFHTKRLDEITVCYAVFKLDIKRETTRPIRTIDKTSSFSNSENPFSSLCLYFASLQN